MDGAAFLLLTSSVLRSAMQLEPESAQQICDALSVVRSKLDTDPALSRSFYELRTICRQRLSMPHGVENGPRTVKQAKTGSCVRML